MTKKIDHPSVIYRPTRKLKKLFQKKVKELYKLDGHTTQDRVLIELTFLWVTGKIKIPGEQ